MKTIHMTPKDRQYGRKTTIRLHPSQRDALEADARHLAAELGTDVYAYNVIAAAIGIARGIAPADDTSKQIMQHLTHMRGKR